MKFILLINVKMPTINTSSERLKAIHFFTCQYFSFYEQLKFCAQSSMKKVLYPGGLVCGLIYPEIKILQSQYIALLQDKSVIIITVIINLKLCSN